MTGASEKFRLPQEKWHATLTEMIEVVNSAFVSKGKSAPQSEVDAEVAVEAIYSHFRGETLYLPIESRIKRARLHASIFADFDGHNQPELSRKYGMSVQAIYRIIKKQRELNVSKGVDCND